LVCVCFERERRKKDELIVSSFVLKQHHDI
jgi:hypothetical protein